MQQLALRNITGAENTTFQSSIWNIQSQIGFAMPFIRAVTVKALVRKDRPHVAIEAERFVRVSNGDRSKRSHTTRNAAPERREIGGK